MAEEQNREDQKRVPLRERGRQWFLTIGTVLALLATTISFLSDSVGVWEFLQGDEPQPTATANSRVALEKIVAATATSTPTGAPTATLTPTIAPTETPWPVKALANERLLLVAQFTNFATDSNYNVAGRIHEALSAQIQRARLEDTRVDLWPNTIGDNASASGVLKGTAATLVIWGEYDSGRVRVRFTGASSGEELDWQRLLGAPTELSTTINLDVPRETQALALMALGRVYRNAGDMVRARAAFAQALAQQPADEDTVATLTFYLAVLDAAASPPALDRAIEGYTKVIEMRPLWFNARYNRGLAYLTRFWLSAEEANLDHAIDDFSWTLGVKDSYSEAYINRGIAFYARNGESDLDASVRDFTSAIRYNPNSYRAYYNRGLSYIRLDQQMNWVSDLENALKIAPDFWVSHHALCWGYALDILPEPGMEHCDAATLRDSTGSTRDGRGLMLVSTGRLDEAIVDIEHYLSWLDSQPEVWSEINNRHIYEEILEGLHAGENRVTPELLEQLR